MTGNERFASYPLRQSLLPGAEGLQIFAIRGVVDWLSRPDRYLVVCEGRGGQIYAAEEYLLEEAQQLIRDAHGDQVVLRKPEVHSFVDPVLDARVEPVMFLRIKTPHAYAREILSELKRREARILEEDLQRYDLVIRAEGRLVNLLGLMRAIGSAARDSSTVWTWLDRYETAVPRPYRQSESVLPPSCPFSGDGSSPSAQ